MRYAVIIPACDEEACIVPVLEELQRHLSPETFSICVGVNGCSDRTAILARSAGVFVAETAKRGYGYGCRAAIDLVDRGLMEIAGYIFCAADGANDPSDIHRLVAEFENGTPIVLGSRTTSPENRVAMGWRYVVANRILGMISGILANRHFDDLGPLRLIERDTFHRLDLREWTYGWTAEAQVIAGRLGIPQLEIPVTERSRLAGVQKVSRVSWNRNLAVGVAIISAAFRARRRADRLLRHPRTVVRSVTPGAPVIPPAH